MSKIVPSQLSVSTLEKLQAHALRIIDGDLDEVRSSLTALRDTLSVEYLINANPFPPKESTPDVWDAYWQTRDYIIELFQSLFEINSFAVSDAPLCSLLKPFLDETLKSGIVDAILGRIEDLSKALAGEYGLLPLASSGIISEQVSLSTLLHSTVTFQAPTLRNSKRICDTLASLKQGHHITVPLTMAALSSFRADCPLYIMAPIKEKICVKDLISVQEHILAPNAPVFAQPHLKSLLLLVISIGIAAAYDESHFGSHAPDALADTFGSSSKSKTSDNSTSSYLHMALPWLVSQVLSCIDRPYDPVTSPILLVQSSDSSSKTEVLIPENDTFSFFLEQSSAAEDSGLLRIPHFVLNSRLQEVVINELQIFSLNIISILPRMLNDLKNAADTALLEQSEMICDSLNGQACLLHGGLPSKSLGSSSKLSPLDIEIFSFFLTLIFGGHSQRCRLFWDSENPQATTFFRFLQTVSLSPHRRLQKCAYSLIAALIHDSNAATRAFHLIQDESLGTISWTSLFSGIDYYVNSFRKIATYGLCTALECSHANDSQNQERHGGNISKSSATRGGSLLSEPPKNFSSSQDSKPCLHLPPSRSHISTPSGPRALISDAEVGLIISLLRVLRQVCRYDFAARRTILSSGPHDVMALLFDFLTCPVPLQLKAAIVDVFASLVARTPVEFNLECGMNVVENQASQTFRHQIIQRIWSYVEAISLIPQVTLAIGQNKAGLKQELDTRECPLRHYPLSIAYLRLLRNLTPQQEVENFSNTFSGPQLVSPYNSDAAGQLFSLVENLGASHRPPGVLPYYSYMQHELFLKAEMRDYVSKKELWVKWRLCLAIIYDSLLDFNLIFADQNVFKNVDSIHSTNSSSFAETEENLNRSNFYRRLINHPAFFFLSEILDGKALLDGILRVISKGRELYNDSVRISQVGLNSTLDCNQTNKSPQPATGYLAKKIAPCEGHAFKEESEISCVITTFPEYDDSLLYAFRIIHQVLLMQARFLHQIIPALVSFSQRDYSSVASRRELDVLLATRRQAIVDIVFFIKSPNQSVFLDEIGILSLQILTAISLSPTFSPIHPGSISLVQIISSSDLAEPIKLAYRQRMMATVSDENPTPILQIDEYHLSSVRLAMLHLLVYNLRTRAVPSIAHALLGLTASDSRLNLYSSKVSSTSLFSVIITILLEDASFSYLAEEKALELVYQLISTPQTFPLCTYLKGHKFFAKIIKRRLRPERIRFAIEGNRGDSAPFVSGGFSLAKFTGDDNSPDQEGEALRISHHTPSKSFFSPGGASLNRRTPSVLDFRRASTFEAYSVAGRYETPQKGIEKQSSTSESQKKERIMIEKNTSARKAVLNTVAILGSWSWILRSVAVQIKVSANQSVYLNTLFLELFGSRTQPRLCLLIDAIMGVSVQEEEKSQTVLDAQDAAVQFFELVSRSLPNGWPNRVDENGCTIYDIISCRQILLRLLPVYMGQTLSKEASNQITIFMASPLKNILETADNPGHRVITAIITFMIEENKKRRVYTAQVKCVKAWLELLSVTLLTDLEQFGNNRELTGMLSILGLYVCKHLKSSPTECKESFSKVLVLIISVMHRVVTLANMEEPRIIELLHTILDCIKATDSNIVVRGNLYAALQVYLAFTSSLPIPIDLDSSVFRRSSARNSSIFRQNMQCSDDEKSAPHFAMNMGISFLVHEKLESQNQQLLKSIGGEKLLGVLCTDATAPGLWQTVALSLLDTLLKYSQRDRVHWVYDYFVSKGCIARFLGILKHLGPILTHITHSREITQSELSSLYVYEALMGLLTRLAHCKPSCDILVGVGLISVLNECTFLTYRVGLIDRVDSSPLGTAVSYPDPFAIFLKAVTTSQDKPSLEMLGRFNQVLIPVLDLVTTVASTMSMATDRNHEYLMKSIEHFMTTHNATMLRVIRGCLNLVQFRVPTSDDEYELALLLQAKQIACLQEFLGQNKLPAPAELTESLLMIFLRYTRPERGIEMKSKKVLEQSSFQENQNETVMAMSQGLAAKIMLETCSHVVSYCFSLLWDPSSEGVALYDDNSKKGISTKSSQYADWFPSSIQPNSIESQRDVLYIFEPDLGAAKDIFYSGGNNRVTLGLLVLHMHRIARRLRVAVDSLTEIKQKQVSGILNQEDWQRFVASPDACGEISYRVQFDLVPSEKRQVIFRQQMILRSVEIETELSSLVRSIEISLSVFYLHLRHYTIHLDQGPFREFKKGINKGIQESKRIKMSLSNLKIDAISVLPELDRVLLKNLILPKEYGTSSDFLKFLCRATSERISCCSN